MERLLQRLHEQPWWPRLKGWATTLMGFSGAFLSSGGLHSPMLFLAGIALVGGSAALWFLVPPVPDKGSRY